MRYDIRFTKAARTMKTRVRNIGNSLGVILPASVLHAMHVREGTISVSPNQGVDFAEGARHHAFAHGQRQESTPK